MKLLIAGFIFLIQMFSFANGDRIKNLPIQDSGRIKPFDSFARESLELIYGRSQFKRPNSDQKEPAHLIILSFLLSPESWINIELFEVGNLELKKKLSLKEDQKYFKGNDLFNSESFRNLMQELENKRQAKEKLDPFFQAVQRLENQFFTFQNISSGKMLRVLPGINVDAWRSVQELPEKYQNKFISISQELARFLGAQAQDKENIQSAGLKLDQTVDDFIQSAAAEFPNYANQKKISAEVFYNQFHFFRWAYIFYLLAALLLLIVWIRDLDKVMSLTWILSFIGLAIHTSGFVFRIYLAERPPVTNMYETVVWVSWGTVVFSMILEKIYKYKSILFAGLLSGVFAMVVADMAPAILDPSIQPLEAVLRSNYWLIIHVMTITISYAAFLLAFALGDIGLIYHVLDSEKHKEVIRNISTAIYRAMQIGVAFLAPGIILGGVWADYSWGRFWGWDPKETWALIVLLGYIIILHTKLINWIQNFGMMVSAVVAFNLVIMAWYGVNFVLGAGLHSYGFGAGGVEYVAVFSILHLLFVIYASVVKKLQSAK